MMMKLRNFAAAAAAVLAAFLSLSLAVEATTVISPDPKQRFEDSNGNPCSGCKLFTYQAGSTTKLATYTDSAGGTSNANPIILDTRGEANVWLTAGTAYKFTLAPSSDTDPPTNPIWTVDQIVGVAGIGSLTGGTGITITGGTSIGLATIANNTVLCNISGSTAVPTACTISSLFSRTSIAANANYYLAPTGSDANDCLTVPTACRTPAHVQTLIDGLDLSSKTVTVNMADGNYAGWSAISANPGSAGPSSITWAGNNATPGNVVVSDASAVVVQNGANLTLNGMTLAGTGLAASGFGYGLNVGYSSQVVFNRLVFAASNNAQISSSVRGRVLLTSGGSYSITGNAPSHLNTQGGGQITISSGTVTLTGIPAFSAAFAISGLAGLIEASSDTFAGTATGQRYQTSLNGVINTGTGAGNVDNSYLPGNSAGSSVSGGQYN